MGDSLLILAVLTMIPLCMMLFVFGGKSRVIVVFLLSGIFMALFAGQIDGLILSVSNMTIQSVTENISPITEEVLKALPVVVFAFLFRPDRQLLIECSASVGIGFSLLENVFLFSRTGRVTLLWALIRGFGSGMMHAICTLIIGDAMHVIAGKRKLFFPGVLAALSTSIIYHSIYNIIVQSEYSLFGILLPVVTYIPLLVFVFNKKTAMHPVPNATDINPMQMNSDRQ